MQQAVTEIESDARLQELIVRFDGQLDRSSIAPLDT
jgi:DNA polymerase-3 subunit gamma/tau